MGEPKNEIISGNHSLKEFGLSKIFEAKPEVAEKIRAAEEVFSRRLEQVTNGFLDGTQRIMDAVPNKILATAILAGGETIGFGGYGITDAFTLISGVRDIAEGRLLKDSSRQKAYLRGGLKIIAAVTPVIPTFWAEPAAKFFMPIPALDKH